MLFAHACSDIGQSHTGTVRAAYGQQQVDVVHGATYDKDLVAMKLGRLIMSAMVEKEEDFR